MDRSHSKVAEARLVRGGLRRRAAVLLGVDGGRVGCRVRVDVRIVGAITGGARWTMVVVDRRFSWIGWLIVRFRLLVLCVTDIQFSCR